MKILVVMHAADNEMLSQNLKQYQALLANCTEGKVEADTYLYTEGILDEKLLKNPLERKLFFERISVIAPGNIAKQIIRLTDEESYEGIILLEDTLSNDVAGIAAIQLSWSYATNVSQLKWESAGLKCSRFVYNNNVKAELQLLKDAFVISLCTMKCEEVKEKREKELQIIYLDSLEPPKYIMQQKVISVRKTEKQSKILIAVGRGVKSKEAVNEIREFAQQQGYLFGVTRPVAMNAWGKIDDIFGVSGSIYAPKICVTIGISGATAFYAGIENSDFIISINSDQRAPIIGMSDVSIVDNYENVLNRLFTKLERK
ncbi:MAG: FAD-binding protein [Lachnospiraceae bacterium]